MASTLLAVVVTLIVAHVAPDLARLRRFAWVAHLVRGLARVLGGTGLWRGYSGALLTLAVPTLLLWVVQCSLSGWAYGLGSFVLGCVVLFYCWGPRDLDLDVSDWVHAADPEARAAALRALYSQGPPSAAQPQVLTDVVFQAALVRWFGVLFWFLLLGPAGALLYRVTQVLASAAEPAIEAPAEQKPAFERLAQLMNWPVAQLMALALAVAADFDAVAAAWRDYHAAQGKVLVWDNGFLFAAARAAVDADVQQFEPEHADAAIEAQDALALAWRVLYVWGVVFALFVLAGKVD